MGYESIGGEKVSISSPSNALWLLQAFIGFEILNSQTDYEQTCNKYNTIKCVVCESNSVSL